MDISMPALISRHLASSVFTVSTNDSQYVFASSTYTSIPVRTRNRSLMRGHEASDSATLMTRSHFFRIGPLKSDAACAKSHRAPDQIGPTRIGPILQRRLHLTVASFKRDVTCVTCCSMRANDA